MSTRIGTMQAPRAGHLFWLPALLALLVVVTFALVVVSNDRDRGREDAGSSTPASTLANTPTELRGGLVQAAATDQVSVGTTGRRGVTPRVPAVDEPTSNAPTYHSGQLR